MHKYIEIIKAKSGTYYKIKPFTYQHIHFDPGIYATLYDAKRVHLSIRTYGRIPDYAAKIEVLAKLARQAARQEKSSPEHKAEKAKIAYYKSLMRGYLVYQVLLLDLVEHIAANPVNCDYSRLEREKLINEYKAKLSAIEASHGSKLAAIANTSYAINRGYFAANASNLQFDSLLNHRLNELKTYCQASKNSVSKTAKQHNLELKLRIDSINQYFNDNTFSDLC